MNRPEGDMYESLSRDSLRGEFSRQRKSVAELDRLRKENEELKDQLNEADAGQMCNYCFERLDRGENDPKYDALRQAVKELGEALDRLSLHEALGSPRMIDKSSDQELLLRMDYARTISAKHRHLWEGK